MEKSSRKNKQNVKDKKEKILYQCEIPDFQIVPYVRMTRRGKYICRQAQRYIENQKKLSWLLSVSHSGKTITDNITISYNVHLSHNRKVDNDNICKALCDALQKAGIIKNDCLIRGICKGSIYQNGINRVVVQLKKWKQESMRI